MIRLEDLKYYQANSKDNNTGDCVKRALSLAYNIDYNKVGNELRKIRRDGNYPAWNIPIVFDKFITAHGLISKKEHKSGERITVGEYAESHTSGTYIILCGKSQTTRSTHMVTIVNGDIYDTWNCSKYFVCTEYTIEESSSAVSGSKDNMDVYTQTVRDVIESGDIFDKIDKKYHKKYRDLIFTCTISIINISIYSYELFVKSILELNNKKYTCDMLLKISPRNTTEQNIEIIKKLISRYIDGAYNKAITDLYNYERYKYIEDEYEDKFYGSSEDSKIRAKLPYWCRRLILFIDKSSWGDGYSRYTEYYVKMQALKDDPRYEKDKTVVFRADNLRELIDNIEMYKKDYSRVDYDY